MICRGGSQGLTRTQATSSSPAATFSVVPLTKLWLWNQLCPGSVCDFVPLAFWDVSQTQVPLGLAPAGSASSNQATSPGGIVGADAVETTQKVGFAPSR